jgi:hypothetical protein
MKITVAAHIICKDEMLFADTAVLIGTMRMLATGIRMMKRKKVETHRQRHNALAIMKKPELNAPAFLCWWVARGYQIVKRRQSLRLTGMCS